MPYIDAPYLEQALGAAKVAALCPTTDELSAVIEQATAETRSALSIGGYYSAVPETAFATVSACPGEIKLAAFGAFLELAYGRRDLELPDSYRAYVQKIEQLKKGMLEMVGVERNVSRAPGGVSFTSNAQDVTQGGRPQVFNRKTYLGY
jgi:hypothetical protein